MHRRLHPVVPDADGCRNCRRRPLCRLVRSGALHPEAATCPAPPARPPRRRG